MDILKRFGTVVVIGQLVAVHGGQTLSLTDVKAVFAHGFVFVFDNHQVTAIPAVSVQRADRIIEYRP